MWVKGWKYSSFERISIIVQWWCMQVINSVCMLYLDSYSDSSVDIRVKFRTSFMNVNLIILAIKFVYRNIFQKICKWQEWHDLISKISFFFLLFLCSFISCFGPAFSFFLRQKDIEGIGFGWVKPFAVLGCWTGVRSQLFRSVMEDKFF